MSTNTQVESDQINSLRSIEQKEFCDHAKQRQRGALERLRGSTKGKGLLEKLLVARSLERAHG